MNKRLVDDLQISALFSAVFGLAIYLIMQRLNTALWWLCFVAGGGLFAIIAFYLIGYNHLWLSATQMPSELPALTFFSKPKAIS